MIVLEARDRVGGRAWNADIGGGEITERGATFAGPTQDHVLALAAEDEGRHLPDLQQRRQPLPRRGHPAALRRLRPDRARAARPGDPPRPGDLRPRLDEMATRSPSTPPGRRRTPPTYDAQTLEQFIEREHVTPRFRTLVAGRHAADLRRRAARALAALHALLHRRLGQRAERRAPSSATSTPRGGAQESRFVGGSQRICERLAQKLGQASGAESPVHRISQEPRRRDRALRAARRRAKRVIVAIPPVLTGQIDYEPGLPDRADRADRALPAGKPDQGRPPSTTARSGATTASPARCSPTRARSTPPSTTRPRTAARASCSASSAATRRARSRRSAAGAPRRGAGQLRRLLRPAGRQPGEYIETAWKRES